MKVMPTEVEHRVKINDFEVWLESAGEESGRDESQESLAGYYEWVRNSSMAKRTGRT